MCGIVGGHLKGVTQSQLKQIETLVLESRIRGMHATGVSYFKENKIETFSLPVKADDFLDAHPVESWVDKSEIKFILHCRYSTSGIDFNQPITFGPHLSIVHNGVITQDPPSEWGRYGYEVETTNDSEMVWRCLDKGEEPLVKFPDSSMSVIELWGDGSMRWYRNGKRPLHSCTLENGFLLASTSDVFVRSGLLPSDLLTPGTVYNRVRHQRVVKSEELICV